MDKKNSLEQLDESLYHQLFSSTAAAISVSYESGELIECNDAMESLTGYSKSDLKKINLGEIYSEPGTREEIIERLRDEGSVEDAEVQIVTKSGDKRWTSLSAKLVKFNGKNVLLSVGIDVTKRKNMEKELKIFKDFADASSLGYGFADLDGNIIYSNPALNRMLGVAEPEQAIGKNVAIYYTDDERTFLINEVLPKVMRDGQWTGELALRSIEGKITPAIQNVTLIRDDEGTPLFLGNVITNIAERKLAELALKESKERYLSLFQTAPNVILHLSPDGQILDFNPEAERLYGWIREDVLGLDYIEHCIPENFRKSVRSNIKKVMDGTATKGYENPIVLPDGSKRTMVWNVDAMLDAEGRSTSIIAAGLDITERIQTEDALRVSEEKFSIAFRSNPCTVTISSLEDGRLIDINKAFVHQTGYTRSEAIGKTALELKLWPIPEQRDALIRKLLQDGSVHDFECVNSNKAGTITTGILSGEIITLENEPCLLAIVMDITKRKQAEESLGETYRIINRSPVIIFIWKQGDYDWPVDFVTENVENLFKYTNEEFQTGKISYHRIIHPNDLERVREEVRKYSSEDDRERFRHKPYRIIAKDGSIKWVDDLTELGRDSKGKITHYIGIVTDITEKKLAEDKLSAAQALLRSAIEQSPAGILIADAPDVNIRLANPAALGIRGKSSISLTGISAELHPQNWQVYYPNGEPFKPEELPLSRAILEGKISKNVEAVIKRPNNDERLVSANAAPVRDSKGKIIAGVVVFNDITETRRLQEFASRAQRLETAGRIAGQVAHDFNNLLSPIRAYPELIKNELDRENDIWKYADEMEKAAVKIAEINDQLLTLSRRGHYNQEPLSLNGIVMEAVNQIYPLPDSLKIHFELESDLMNIIGGRSQIYRVALNLIINARDAMSDIGKLYLKTENYYADRNFGELFRIPKGEYVRLIVTDTGTGIENNIITKIFEPFFTTKSTDKKRGSGLGLSVVHAVMEDHEGYIDCSTRVNSGTSFYLYFPASRKKMAVRPSENIIGGTENILIIDDDELQRNVAGTILEKLGYKPNSVGDGESAIEFLKSNPQDLLVIDMVMPDGIDGTETFRRALTINPDQKAIIISGYAESERVKQALILGAGEFVRKPLSIKVLAKAVRKELDRKFKK
jgi:PAS domain S-box-containing protein